MPLVVPIAKPLILCDFVIGNAEGKVDLYGLFDAIRAPSEFPIVLDRFCVFTQLTNGVGRVPCRIDIRSAATDRLVWTTESRDLNFSDKMAIIRLAWEVQGCPFDVPGVYLVELFCDNVWVGDTRIRLLEPLEDES